MTTNSKWEHGHRLTYCMWSSEDGLSGALIQEASTSDWLGRVLVMVQAIKLLSVRTTLLGILLGELKHPKWIMG
jgi:hypothetical protein